VLFPLDDNFGNALLPRTWPNPQARAIALFPISMPARKRFGQHWLTDDVILNQIVRAAELHPGDRVLEIGPGKGVLTQRLLAGAAHVAAVEIDRDLCRALRKRFANAMNLSLLEADILGVDLTQLWANALPGIPLEPLNKVVANIPYNLTGPILEKLLGTLVTPSPIPFESIVLLVQREVAERLTAIAGSKAFGALSVRIQYLASCELICAVPPQAFKPPPKVESSVIRLIPRPYPLVAQDPHWLNTLVKQGFATRRKMLRNTLGSLVDRDQLLAVLAALDLEPAVRAEGVSVEQWIHLSHRLTPIP
jgi:16S rRNA (adenine1518-N6/adenine1519-N6)-dimethyltransferase